MLTFESEDGPTNVSIVVNVKQDGVFVGKAQFIPHSHEMYEVHISPFALEVRGNTIEIAKHILKMMFRELTHIQKMIAIIPIFKVHAIKIAQDSGFRYEGTITNGHLHLGRMEDLEIYGINREEV